MITQSCIIPPPCVGKTIKKSPLFDCLLRPTPWLWLVENGDQKQNISQLGSSVFIVMVRCDSWPCIPPSVERSAPWRTRTDGWVSVAGVHRGVAIDLTSIMIMYCVEQQGGGVEQTHLTDEHQRWWCTWTLWIPLATTLVKAHQRQYQQYVC